MKQIKLEVLTRNGNSTKTASVGAISRLKNLSLHNESSLVNVVENNRSIVHEKNVLIFNADDVDKVQKEIDSIKSVKPIVLVNGQLADKNISELV